MTVGDKCSLWMNRSRDMLTTLCSLSHIFIFYIPV